MPTVALRRTLSQRPHRMGTDNTRSHVRIHYPSTRRPRLVLPAGVHEVLDLSAEGLLVTVPESAAKPTLGTRVEGTLELPTAGIRAIRKAHRGIPAPPRQTDRDQLLRVGATLRSSASRTG